MSSPPFLHPVFVRNATWRAEWGRLVRSGDLVRVLGLFSSLHLRVDVGGGGVFGPWLEWLCEGRLKGGALQGRTCGKTLLLHCKQQFLFPPDKRLEAC